MAHKVIFKVEEHDDSAFGVLGDAYWGFAKASTDYMFHGPVGYADRYTLGEMPQEMIDWLNQHTKPGTTILGFDQIRHDGLSYTRRLWVKFQRPKDAVAFKLIWSRPGE